MSEQRRNGRWGRKIGIGVSIPSPLPLSLIMRLLDWCIETDDGHDTPCWIWQGHCDSDGYGEVKWRGKKYRASRLAFTAFNGKMKDGTDVDHACRNRACVNPAHLMECDPFTNRVVLRDERREECPI